MTGRSLAWWCLAVLVGAGFHVVEHVVQAVQKYGMDHARAHGLLGAYFDSDPVHFLYNWAFFFALLPALKAGTEAGSRWSWWAFVAGFGVQSYHVVEHTVKTAQWAAGADPALGILGHWFELIPLHLALNAAVYVLVLPRLLLWALQALRPAPRVRAALRAS